MGLVEIVIALGVLVVVGLALTMLAMSTTAGNTRDHDRSSANVLALRQIERMKNQSFASLASGSDGPFHPGEAGGGIFSRSWTVTTSSVVGTPARDVVVTVSWTGGSSLQLATRIVAVAEESPGVPNAFIESWNQP